jgi:hypothetical protein
MNLQSSQQTPDQSALAAARATETRPIFLTVGQFSERNPAFTPAAIRNLVFKAKDRQSSCGVIAGNGLIEAGAILRIGRKVLIDEARFHDWMRRWSGGRK